MHHISVVTHEPPEPPGKPLRHSIPGFSPLLVSHTFAPMLLAHASPQLLARLSAEGTDVGLESGVFANALLFLHGVGLTGFVYETTTTGLSLS